AHVVQQRFIEARVGWVHGNLFPKTRLPEKGGRFFEGGTGPCDNARPTSPSCQYSSQGVRDGSHTWSPTCRIWYLGAWGGAALTSKNESEWPSIRAKALS